MITLNFIFIPSNYMIRVIIIKSYHKVQSSKFKVQSKTITPHTSCQSPPYSSC